MLTSRAPHELVTRTDTTLGLQLEVTSRLRGRSDGTDLELRVVTHWRRGLGLIATVVELAILNPGEARKELAHLKRWSNGRREARPPLADLE